jgi:hypothetical protein
MPLLRGFCKPQKGERVFLKFIHKKCRNRQLIEDFENLTFRRGHPYLIVLLMGM